MGSPHNSDKAVESQQYVPASAAVGTRGPIPTPAFGERVVGAAAIALVASLVSRGGKTHYAASLVSAPTRIPDVPRVVVGDHGDRPLTGDIGMATAPHSPRMQCAVGAAFR